MSNHFVQFIDFTYLPISGIFSTEEMEDYIGKSCQIDGFENSILHFPTISCPSEKESVPGRRFNERKADQFSTKIGMKNT